MKNLLIEKDVLGWCLADDGAFSYCEKRIRAKAFDVPQHRAIWQAMTTLAASGKPTRYAETHAHLIETGALSEAGGQPYLWELFQSSFPSPQRAKFANKLGAISRARHVLSVVQSALPSLANEDPDIGVDRFVEQVNEAAKSDHVESELVPLSVCLDDAFSHYEALAEGTVSRGVPTGIRAVDDMTTCHRGGELVIVGARTSVGKTAFAGTAALAAAKQDVPVAIFSLEMIRRDVAFRFLAGESGLSLSAIRSGTVHEYDRRGLAAANERLRTLPISVFAGSKTSAADADLSGIQSLSRKFRERHKQAREGLIVVDYLQLIQATQGMSEQKRHDIVGQFSRGMKALAMELDWPVMALAQLNRDADKRERPKLSDLRESGSIEQDADCVILIHRPDKDSDTTGASPPADTRFLAFGGTGKRQQSPNGGDPNHTEFIIAKNRNGAIGTVIGRYRPECALFE